MDTKTLYQIFKARPHIVINSKRARRNSIFFALQGDKQNGNAFALEALEKGCDYAVVSDPNLKNNPRCIISQNPLKSLQRLALWHRLQMETKLIAITGTCGKTTTKELITEVLKNKYHTLSTEGNYNNQIGLPLTLLKLRKQHQIAIIEMGASRKHDISFLCSIAQPDLGLITNYGKAHLEKFKNYANIVATKSELYHFLHQSGGIGFVNNRDQTQVAQSQFMSQIHLYGDKSSNFEIIPYTLEDGTACVDFSEIKISSQLLGIYNAENMATAAAIGDYLGVSHQNIKASLESYVAKNQRTEIREINSSTWIIDTYNANPSSMLLAIKMMQQRKEISRKKILILGDMLELGATTLQEHQHIVDVVSSDNTFEKIVLIGAFFEQTNQSGLLNITSFKSISQAQKSFKNMDLTEKVVLIKGSRGMLMESLIPK